MLHVRVVCRPGSADCLAESLAADPGVRNLVVLPGAARRPAGDAVQFDLVTASANRVLRQLRALPASDRGSVAIETVDAAIATPAELLHPPRHRGLIGAVGILTNSQILIVAAMVVGPEYGAIMATALGLSKKDLRPVVAGLCALTLGFAMASVATLLFGLIIRWSGHTPAAYQAAREG